MPVTTAAVIGGAKALTSIGMGAYQNAKAKKINKNNKRPTYNVDTSYQTNVDEANALAKGRVRQFANAETKADEAMANSAALAKGFSGNNTSTAIGSLIASQNQRNEAQRDILGAESAFQANAIGNLANQRQALAEERDKAFDYNQNMPYQNKRQEAINRRNYGNALINQGIQSGFDSTENIYGKGDGTKTKTNSPNMEPVDLVDYSGLPMAKKGIKKVKIKK